MVRSLLCLLCLACLLHPAAAQPPDPGDTITGRITNAAGGRPIAGASISVFLRDRLLRKAFSDEDGRFVAALMIMPAARPQNTVYSVLIEAAGYSPISQSVPAANRIPPLELRLASSVPRTVRVVSLRGENIANAVVQLAGYDQRPFTVRQPRPGVAVRGLPLDLEPVTTGPLGTATLRGLPLTGTLSLSVRAAGYASAIQHLDAAAPGPVTVSLSRETSLYGRVLYADTKEPFYFPGVQVEAIMPRPNHVRRQSEIGPDGSYEVRDIPWAELTAGPWINYGVDPMLQRDVPRVKPDLSIRYTPSGRRQDVLVTREVNGVPRWYIGYVVAGERGVRFREGERIQRDILLQPAARITGRVEPGTAAKPTTIRYTDPRSMFANATATPDATGRFEIFVAPGDITMSLGAGRRNEIVVQGLKPFETREVQLRKADD